MHPDLAAGLHRLEQTWVTKDSGERVAYGTGARRDTAKGKGLYVCIPPAALRRLAGVYERGAFDKGYGMWNWEKGMPFSRLYDSAMRHLCQWREGLRDEDHLAQAAFNVFALIHFEEIGRAVELNDIPRYVEGAAEETGVAERARGEAIPLPGMLAPVHRGDARAGQGQASQGRPPVLGTHDGRRPASRRHRWAVRFADGGRRLLRALGRAARGIAVAHAGADRAYERAIRDLEVARAYDSLRDR